MTASFNYGQCIALSVYIQPESFAYKQYNLPLYGKTH